MRKPLPSDSLPFAVNLWDEEERSISAVVARASSLQVARAAFDAAVAAMPNRMVTLHGPGALDVQAPTNAAWGCEHVQVH